MISYTKESDEDDEKYRKIIEEPVFADEKQLEKDYNNWNTFLDNIFGQPLEKCKRRNDAEGSKGYAYCKQSEKYYELFKRINKTKQFVKRVIKR